MIYLGGWVGGRVSRWVTFSTFLVPSGRVKGYMCYAERHGEFFF